MISIQLENGNLDIPTGEEISITHTPYRFCETMQDEWTNDFTVPATRHNIQILDSQGLLYANNQRYGSEIKPCVLNINGKMVDARVQVVSVRDDEIDLCLYVSKVPEALKGKTLRDFFTDDSTTTLPWNRNSANNYPSWFPTYWYGMPYTPDCAQRHPAKPLNSILMSIQNQSGVTIQMPDKNYYVVAQHRVMSPQCAKQTIFGTKNDASTGVIQGLKLKGSTHIANDLDDSETEVITFNRPCNVQMNIYVSWDYNKTDAQRIQWFFNILTQKKNQSTLNHSFQLGTDLYTNRIEHFTFNWNFDEGEMLRFAGTHSKDYKIFDIQAELTITGYDITNDDYTTDELQYDAVGTEMEVANLVDRTDDGITYRYRDRGSWNVVHQDYVLAKRLPYSYFGYWANIEDVKVTELLYHIAFLEGKEAVWDAFRNEITFVQSDRYKVLDDATITEYCPTSTLFGQKNYITFKSQDTKDLQPVSKVDSIYLEDEKVLKESIFCTNKMYSYNGQQYGGIAQYGNLEYDKTTKETKCDYEDIEGLCMLEGVTVNGKTTLYPIELNNNGLEAITSVMEVKMTDISNTDLTQTDYIYKNGVKMMITNINTTLNSNGNENNITAVVVPEQLLQ